MISWKVVVPMFFIVANGLSFSANAEMVLEGQFTQGGMVIGKTLPGDSVVVGERQVKVSKDGEFVFGFGRDHGPSQTITVKRDGKTVESKTVSVAAREYDIQKVDGLPPKTVNPPEKVLERIRKETNMVNKARKHDDERTDFMNVFQWPLIGPITGVYGSQRVLNGEPKRPHYGLDIAAPVGTAVKAPAPGIVTLAHDNMYYSGGTLILDHGHGLSSTFIHLNKTLVKVGDVIKTGDMIAEVGSKGRSTGPHLDWRMNWFDQRLDPALLMGEMPKD